MFGGHTIVIDLGIGHTPMDAHIAG